jgi:hypothetical protein
MVFLSQHVYFLQRTCLQVATKDLNDRLLDPGVSVSRVGGRCLEYLHRSPASRRRRRRGNPVLGVCLGLPVSGGYKCRGLVLQVGLERKVTTLLCKKLLLETHKVETG